MKKFTYFLLMIIFLVLIAMVSGCSDKGEIYDTQLLLRINNKDHQLKAVRPCSGCAVVYILVPVDPNVEQPISIVDSGKNGNTLIIIK